jgi:hypothetical protein
MPFTLCVGPRCWRRLLQARAWRGGVQGHTHWRGPLYLSPATQLSGPPAHSARWRALSTKRALPDTEELVKDTPVAGQAPGDVDEDEDYAFAAEEQALPPLQRDSDGAVLVVGVDPDVNGALALLRWRPAPSGKSGGAALETHVYDVPASQVASGLLRGRRASRGPPPRRHSPEGMAALVASLQAPRGTVAVLERATARLGNSLQSSFQSGLGFGLWWGVLSSAGFTVRLTLPQAWKKEYGLCGEELDKNDSRAMACAMFPEAAPLLGRKKDHGRAEAVLIAAYGATLLVPTAAEGDASLSAAIMHRRLCAQARLAQADGSSSRADVLDAAAAAARRAAKAAAVAPVKLTAAQQRQRRGERAMAAAARQTVAELKERCKALGLKVSGSKQELLARLQPALTPPEPSGRGRKAKREGGAADEAGGSAAA